MIVAKTPFSRVLVTGLMLVSGAARADIAFRPSVVSLETENQDVIVLHDHAVEFRDSPDGDGLIIWGNSTLRIISKSDGSEILNERVMPLTTLLNVGDGYFAGLSVLRALAAQYNFVLFTQTGEVIATALVTFRSGHCKEVGGTTTNFIFWYDEKDPDAVRLSFEGGRVNEIIVANSHDRTAVDHRGVCVIPVGLQAPLSPPHGAP